MMSRDQLHRQNTGNAVVLIPAYNASATISETLEALQTNPGLYRIRAVIVLDDASRDGTIDVAKLAWRSSVSLEIWSNETNLGERATTNSGIARLPVDIEWAFILHADDVVNSNWISLYLDEMSGCPDDIATICSSYDNWYPASGQIVSGEEYPDRPSVLVRGTRDTVVDTLNRGCWWHLSGCAIRTMAFRQIGGFKVDMPQTGDWEWLLRCLAKGYSVRYLPRSTMRYRQHSTSVSSNSFREARDIKEQFRIFTLYRDQGYFSAVDFGKKIRSMLIQLLRRTLIRAMRCDFIGMRYHAVLLCEIGTRFALKRI